MTAKSGNQVSIDAPIPWTLDPANNQVRVRMTDGQMKENDGLKGMTIQFANNTLASTGRPHGKYLFWRRRKKSAAVGRERKKARAKNINALYPLEDASET